MGEAPREMAIRGCGKVKVRPEELYHEYYLTFGPFQCDMVLTCPARSHIALPRSNHVIISMAVLWTRPLNPV